ncbi:serine/threonine-protein kinase, partial [Nonomuraea aridisoli]|uniref:serine/threonine-protein kinase n=1 Tax=Nonomuraea aridisoli TaxID=2070368 RepID=UPI001C651F99
MDVPGYTEIRELGHGGTGRVMLAVRDSDGLLVAIKHLSETLRADTEFVARFRAEAELIGEIDSPHTARVLDYAEGEDDAVIVMELVDGVTLRRLLEHEGPTGAEAALVVLKGALLGLAEAHRRGVVHRDFKPENVLVTPDGGSKLVDFGVAARAGETAPRVGTPAYMAPEQWDDAPAGPATDVYAATLVFYECLTGHRPFHADDIAALAYQHLHVPPPLEEIDEPLRPLVGHGLAKEPARRPESAEAFLAELEEAARAAYGEEWEPRGRAGLATLTLPPAALLPGAPTGALPDAGGDGGVTSLFHNALTPAGKLAMTGGLVLATAAAVTAAFVIWSEPPGRSSGSALPPASPVAPAAPATTSAPPTPAVSRTPSPDRTRSPDRTPSPEPTLSEATGPPVVSRPVTDARPPSRAPVRNVAAPPSRPTRAPATREPTRAPEPTRSQRPEPSSPPSTSSPETRPDEPPATVPDDPPDGPPGGGEEPPPATQAPP